MHILLFLSAIPVIALYVLKLTDLKRYRRITQPLRDRDPIGTSNVMETYNLLVFMLIYNVFWTLILMFIFALYADVQIITIISLMVLIVVSVIIYQFQKVAKPDGRTHLVLEWLETLVNFAIISTMLYYTSIVHML